MAIRCPLRCSGTAPAAYMKLPCDRHLYKLKRFDKMCQYVNGSLQCSAGRFSHGAIMQLQQLLTCKREYDGLSKSIIHTSIEFWVCALRGQHELPRNPWSASRCSQRVPGMARASNRQRSRNWPPLGGCEALWSMPTNATGINILQTSTDYQNIQYEDVKDIKIQCKSTV